jgi:hypothetical protein
MAEPDSHRFGEGWLNFDPQVLGFLHRVSFAAHEDPRRRPKISRSSVRSTPLFDLDATGNAVEGESLRKHIAKVEGDAPRQRLQAEHPEQSPDARVELGKLAVFDAARSFFLQDSARAAQWAGRAIPTRPSRLPLPRRTASG